MDDQNIEQQSTTNGLESIRQRALNSLIPLVDQLQESPERKFELFMTAVRASHSEDVLAKALGAAEQIGDPNVKAEALIDLINEANYQLER